MNLLIIMIALAIFPLSSGQILESECHVSGTGYHETSISGANFEETVYYFEVCLNYNITRDGLLTFEDGSQVQLTDDHGCLEWVPI